MMSHDLERLFPLPEPDNAKAAQRTAICLAARTLAGVMLDSLGRHCGDRDAALRKLRESVWAANEALTLDCRDGLMPFALGEGCGPSGIRRLKVADSEASCPER